MSVKVGWGHSCVGKVADLAHAANVKTLYLFHHDSDQDDADIDNKFDLAKEYLSKKNRRLRFCLRARATASKFDTHSPNVRWRGGYFFHKHAK